MIKDTGYASLFDKKDLPSLYRYAEKVRATHDNNLVDDFNNKCEKKWNDHNPLLGDIEFLQVSKADDIVVNGGIDESINNILGASLVYWTLMGCGTGVTAATAADVGLQANIGFNKSTLTQGWREIAGTSLRFGTIWGESVSTLTITEMAVFRATGGVILNRNVFSNFPITHTINFTGFVLSSVVEFVPVM